MNKIKYILLCLVLLLSGCSHQSKNDMTLISDSMNIYFEYKNFNTESIEYLAPKDFWTLLKDEFNIDIHNQSDLKIYYQDHMEQQKSLAKEFYGVYEKDCPLYVFNSKSEEELSKENLDIIKNALNQYYGINKNKIKKAYSVSFTYDIVGDKKMEKKHELLTFVRISGKYYPINEYYNFIVNPKKTNSIIKQKKISHSTDLVFLWWTLQDSNLRPTGYEPVALTN